MENWKRLAAYVRSRRLDPAIGYSSQEALADAAGVSARTVFAVERGRRVSRNTLAVIERTLAWKPGSAEEILSGGEPSEIRHEPEPVLIDPDEQALWALKTLDEQTRWSLITHLREQRRRQTG